jgi:uncharacterized protein YjgD (DUF1641 family)
MSGNVDAVEPLDEELFELLENVGEHRDALEGLAETAEALEGSGMLDLLEVVATRDASTNEQLYDAFVEDEGKLRLVQNLTLLTSVASRVDPDSLAHGLEALSGDDGLAAVADERPPRVGPVGAFKRLRDPDVQRGLGLVFELLEAVGRQYDGK